MASPNLSELVTTTLRNRRGRLADNVTNHIPLLKRLNMRGNVQTADGGRVLAEELEYAENSTFKYYSGYEQLDISPSDIMTSAEFDWKQAAVVVTISGLQQRQNSGREQVIRLLDRRIRNAEKTMMNQLSVGIFSDGTGSSGKQIGGLQHLVAKSPSTGTVGSINRANHSFWRNQTKDFSSDLNTSASASTIQQGMNAIWLDCVRNADHPNLIVADGNYYNFYKESLQSIQRITSERDAAAGFSELVFYGAGGRAEVIYDPQTPTSTMYFLNTDYLFWRPHRDANMDPLDRRSSVNQDATVVPIIFMGNMTMSNASLQGVLKE